MVFSKHSIRIALLLLLAIIVVPGQAQDALTPGERSVVDMVLQPGEVYTFTSFEGTHGPHLSYFFKSSEDLNVLQSQIHEEGWNDIQQDPHADQDQFSISRMGYLQAGQTLKVRSSKSIHVEFHRYQPGFSDGIQHDVQSREIECSCPAPAILSRQEWCNNCPTDASPVFTEAQHLIVHHSAGTNTSSDWAAVVRSIWDFHVNGNGWDDIGYNYVIDPEGVIYTGRGEGLMGAHFCGTNGGTLGVCLLGNYSGVAPSDTSLLSLQQLASWQLCKWKKNPTRQSLHSSSNLNLFHISGHRDGCATACPGQQVYDRLPALRDNTLNTMLACDDSISFEPMMLEGLFISDFKRGLNYANIPFAEASIELIERVDLGFGSAEDSRPIDENEQLILDVFPDRTYEYQIRADYPNGRRRFSNIVRFVIPGLPFGKSRTRIEPNPVQQDLTLVLFNQRRGTYKLTLFDVNGKQLRELSFDKDSVEYRVQIDMSGYPSGLYFLQVDHEDERKTLQFIKGQ